MEKRKYLIDKKMAIKNLVILILLFSVVEFCICSNDITMPHGQTDFSMLSCTEIRNITLVMGMYEDYKFYRYFNDLITNEYCFYVNMYLNSEDRVVRVRNSNDLLYIIERNKHYFEDGRLVKLVDRLYEEKIFGDADGIKQSFIVINFHIGIKSVSSSLKKMQNDRKWDIIIMSWNYKYILWLDWLPLHRFIQTLVFSDIYLINLIDVIKNPDYDRYDAAYQWISSRNDLFNSSCFGKIDKINFMVYSFWEYYFPMTLAVLRKENDRREQEKLKPLRIIFWNYNGYYARIIDSKGKAGGEYVEFVHRWKNHPLYNNYNYTKNEWEIFINVIDWMPEWVCEDYKTLLRIQNYHYQEFKTRYEKNCYSSESIKTFGTMEELWEHI
uniref:Uncharacterized protein n=1 Tax=Clytia hemisphaerica TaxID=252671 RepID=A0A7M5TQC4_9CNID